MSLGSTESQYGLRHVNGVPIRNGDILTLRDYETEALWFRAGLKPGEQERAVARLWANLQRLAKEVVRMCTPQDFEDARGVERLLSYFARKSSRIDACPGEVIGYYIVREQRAFREMTEALRRVRNYRNEKFLEYDVTIIEPPLETPLSTLRLNTIWSKTKTRSQRHRGDKNKLVRLSLSWKFGDIDFSKMHVSLEKSDRWSWLELETTRSTQQS